MTLTDASFVCSESPTQPFPPFKVSQLQFSQVSMSFGGTTVLQDCSFTLTGRMRVCLVGPNGSGKTTLLRLAAGELAPSSGSISTGPAGGTAERIPHPDDVPGDMLVEDFLDVVTAVDRRICAAVEAGDVGDDYAEILQLAEQRDVWSLEARIASICAGIGLGDVAGRTVGQLSGGERARLALAGQLIAQPGVLLLDEPTNHLDAEGCEFLARMVRRWPGPVLFASHDRQFIDEVATSIADVDVEAWDACARAEGQPPVSGLYLCKGNYSNYVVAKAAARASHARIHAAQKQRKRTLTRHAQTSREIGRGGKTLARAQGIEKKFYSDRASATATRRISHDDRQLEQLREREVRKPRPQRMRWQLPPSTGAVVQLRGMYDLDISAGEHVLITGRNGVGKTTLLRSIAQATPHAVLVSQHLPTRADCGADVWEGGCADPVIQGSAWHTPVPQLSAGNQRRVQLGLAAAKAPDVLLLDEPGNYLDVDSMEVVEESLRAWGGTLVVVSHDRWLQRHWWGRVIEL